MKNQQIRLKSRPVGWVKEENFYSADVDVPPLKSDEVLLKTLYISIDPAMRGWLNDVKSYVPPVAIDEVMRAATISQVVQSNNSNFKVGDLVQSFAGWQEYFVSSGKNLQKLKVPPGHPPSLFLGVLGLTGLTAWFGLFDVGQPKAGETVVVSGAAGATGSVAGQLAKLAGCRVVGIAGSDDKCAWLKEIGFDETINYKKCANLDNALRDACPKGIDVYFDNVGGAILDAVLKKIKQNARIVLCGAISDYNNTSIKGPSNYLNLIATRGKIQGFIVFDYVKDYPKAIEKMTEYILQGKLKYKEETVSGISNCPKALLMLFNGDNSGKLIVKAGTPTAKL